MTQGRKLRGRPDRKPANERRRPTAHQRGYTSRWHTARATYLSRPENVLCRHCQAAGITREATEVDHVQPHRGDWTLFWDKANWQPLCKPCHSRKTATEDGGWGNSQRTDSV